ncbi:unannotated protein [freshwater metagenome]|uniref:Unannotated protein n=1 Tax=freshwater metagenome TaxID=449393 RepID=A0A6J7S5N2_9ZZZZ
MINSTIRKGDVGVSEPIDFQPFIEMFMGQVPGGPEGDLEIRRRIGLDFVDTTDENVHREPTLEEVDAWIQYAAWNVWGTVAQRASEGESGLIPRQEYESLAFVQEWAKTPQLMREITEAIGVDGVIELGRTSHREVGNKINVLRNWGLPMCPLIGRGISIHLGLEDHTERQGDIASVVQFARRLQHGTFGGGSGLVSGRGFVQQTLGQEILDRFLADEERLDDPEQLGIFRKFNASTELLGFLIHWDSRAGMQDSGPYPVPGGGFMIVREHFLYETEYEWASVAEGLPYCVIEAMIFRPDVPVHVAINDLGTTFTEPRDYLKHLSGVAVYARDRVDSPMSELRRVDAAEMSAITKKSNVGMLELYKVIAGKSREQKIRDGIVVYTHDMISFHAKAAGIWDSVKTTYDDWHPLTEAAYPVLSTSRAGEILPIVLLLEGGFPTFGAKAGS